MGDQKFAMGSVGFKLQKCLRSLVLDILIETCFGYGTPVDIYLTHSTICRVFSQCEEARTVLLRRWLPEVFSNQNILVSLIVK